ncbi:hypothetical protein HPB51_000198 [Rhipicephalus microplus]|uniref:Uncharacterized protein n=1 Tax=Rhipicephalus microplus TaxID=6941 RepID=A0A9J6E4H7_RHIMP|nr:hypothetical protein HPB51_000198 [Rhipicephalus microplus]
MFFLGPKRRVLVPRALGNLCPSAEHTPPYYKALVALSRELTAMDPDLDPREIAPVRLCEQLVSSRGTLRCPPPTFPWPELTAAVQECVRAAANPRGASYRKLSHPTVPCDCLYYRSPIESTASVTSNLGRLSLDSILRSEGYQPSTLTTRPPQRDGAAIEVLSHGAVAYPNQLDIQGCRRFRPEFKLPSGEARKIGVLDTDGAKTFLLVSGQRDAWITSAMASQKQAKATRRAGCLR